MVKTMWKFTKDSIILRFRKYLTARQIIATKSNLSGMPCAGKSARGPTNKAKSTSGNARYDVIKSQCLSSGKLWEDPHFPVVDSSLSNMKPPSEGVEWKRPRVSKRSDQS